MALLGHRAAQLGHSPTAGVHRGVWGAAPAGEGRRGHRPAPTLQLWFQPGPPGGRRGAGARQGCSNPGSPTASCGWCPPASPLQGAPDEASERTFRTGRSGRVCPRGQRWPDPQTQGALMETRSGGHGTDPEFHTQSDPRADPGPPSPASAPRSSLRADPGPPGATPPSDPSADPDPTRAQTQIRPERRAQSAPGAQTPGRSRARRPRPAALTPESVWISHRSLRSAGAPPPSL